MATNRSEHKRHLVASVVYLLLALLFFRSSLALYNDYGKVFSLVEGGGCVLFTGLFLREVIVLSMYRKPN